MGEEAPNAIVVCRGCDRLYERKALPRGDVARCRRCGTGLYGAFRHDLDAVLALSLSAVILFVFSYSVPLMSFAASGQSQSGNVLSGVVGLYEEGFLWLALLVFLTATALPFCHMVGLCYVLLAGRFDLPLPGGLLIFRAVRRLPTWAMLEVYVVAALVAYVKLGDFGSVHPHLALVGLFLAATAVMAAEFFLDSGELFAALRRSESRPRLLGKGRQQ